MKQDEIRLGFLVIKDIGEDNSIRGIILVTDGNTHPLELRYSDAIEVTTLEKIAFGLKLKEGVAVSRIGIPLVKTLSEHPQVLIVNDKDILRVQKSVEYPVVHFTLCNEDIDGDISAGEELISVFSNDADILEKFRKIRAIFQEDIDFNEPLDRAVKALEHIHFNKEL